MINLEEKVIEKTEEKIKEIIESDITPSNLEHLDKLVDIYKDMKEVESMNYGNYGNYSGRRAGYDSYGRGYGESYNNYGNEYGRSYGRRGYDMKYRGDAEFERMADEYGRYMESRERYGDGSQESESSFHYMVKSLEDFVKFLYEDAKTTQQKQMISEAIQRSMR